MHQNAFGFSLYGNRSLSKILIPREAVTESIERDAWIKQIQSLLGTRPAIRHMVLLSMIRSDDRSVIIITLLSPNVFCFKEIDGDFNFLCLTQCYIH